MKDKVDGFLTRWGMRGLSDKVLQMFTKLLPNHLPERMNQFRDLYEHHLILRFYWIILSRAAQAVFSCVVKMKDARHFCIALLWQVLQSVIVIHIEMKWKTLLL
ncbi:D-lactate dehydrogenase [Mycobacteroides abscessus subsp. abscessus]|nr:D-lactate dehydrogenase [Mycobacteroides abscessus subsp. abscessus]